MRFITTSWDDGFPSDFRIAELLDKYNIKGTFYIPKYNLENKVMRESDIVNLSKFFEIGGHTINHTRISSQSVDLFNDEIFGCYKWLTELLSYNPTSFCFPGGIYNKNAILFAKKVGFKTIRTTELLSLKNMNADYIVPTTLQLYNHSRYTYVKHLLKRQKYTSLSLFYTITKFRKSTSLVEGYLKHMLQHGGCFHLWGHSWEIDKYNLWGQLENILSLISGISQVEYITNAELLNTKSNLK